MKSVIADHPVVVYVIAADENGPCKIGISSNVNSRLDQLQAGCWLPLRLWGFRMVIFETGSSKYRSILASVAASAKMVEAECHKTLKGLDLHMVGEWFDVSASEALEVVEKCARMNKARAVSIEDIMSVTPDPETHRSLSSLHLRMARFMVGIAQTNYS